ncbi:MAG: hypothetical protein HYY45_08250 [Deltaproteobacteria bacterium]|nr:hypothetical protein [Deltaproteobacteria bacterium]
MLRKLVIAFLLTLLLLPAVGYAQEKNATIVSYDKDSRMVELKGKDWEQKAKVSSSVAGEKADLLKPGTKVKVELDDRGGGDVRVKGLNAR